MRSWSRDCRDRQLRPRRAGDRPQGELARCTVPPGTVWRGGHAFPQEIPRMIIYPAMDLMGGRVVRLKQGRFEDQTTYPAEPAAALRAFAEAGADWAHVVDLDGARAKAPVQHELIASLAKSTSLRLQVGGGFRTRDQV